MNLHLAKNWTYCVYMDLKLALESDQMSPHMTLDPL
jgi:hypothetical protein